MNNNIIFHTTTEGRAITMATNTFERKIEISDPESVKKLFTIMTKEKPQEPLSTHPYTTAEREKSDQLLKQCLSRSRR